MESSRNETNVEADRETGKQLMFSPESTREDKNRGISLLMSACRKGDPESQYIIGKLLLDGSIVMKAGDSRAKAMEFLWKAAQKEYNPARALLASHCREQYDKAFLSGQEGDHPLTGFDGRRIVIHRTGRFVPVDAVLEYTPDGGNVLTFSLDLTILDEGVEVADSKKLRSAILKGIRMWEGNYTVFGGQQLQVKINITKDEKIFDNVLVVLMAGDTLNRISKALSSRHSEKALRAREMIRDKRSMATMGFKKWSVRSRKVIYLHSNNDRFSDYDEISHIIKHEFGHVLGLGDLYREAEAGMPGVPAGYYKELDSFILKDRFYHLVMCDHHGLISNNDIEMVVLAFSENRLQQYQPTEKNNDVSEALGKGN